MAQAQCCYCYHKTQASLPPWQTVRNLMPTLPVATLLMFAAVMYGSPNSAVFEVQWASDLRLARPSKAMERLREPFDSPLPYKNANQRLEAGNCVDLIAYRKSGFTPNSDRDAGIAQSLIVDCLAVKALYRATVPRKSFLRAFHLDLQAFELLPPNLAPIISDEDRQKVQSAAAKGISWKQFDSSASASVQGESLAVLSDDTRTTVKIYGRGDFNADGIDDLMVRVDTAAMHGTYRTSRLLLLTKTRSDGILQMIRELN
jgi:hypothetical protein